MKHFKTPQTLEQTPWKILNGSKRMEEREQMVEEAFNRARDGQADANDWKLIAAELGLRNIFKKEANYVDL
jgi:hypothetical protein